MHIVAAFAQSGLLASDLCSFCNPYAYHMHVLLTADSPVIAPTTAPAAAPAPAPVTMVSTAAQFDVHKKLVPHLLRTGVEKQSISVHIPLTVI
jgi:hypothetical protein